MALCAFALQQTSLVLVRTLTCEGRCFLPESVQISADGALCAGLTIRLEVCTMLEPQPFVVHLESGVLRTYPLNKWTRRWGLRVMWSPDSQAVLVGHESGMERQHVSLAASQAGGRSFGHLTRLQRLVRFCLRR